MIIFFLKSTGEIIGTVSGRVHSEDVLKNAFVQPSGVPKEDIGKYVVPFKTIYEEIETPIVEQRVDLKTMKVEKVIVGKKKENRARGMIPDVSFSGLILDIESGKDDIYSRTVETNKQGKVIGLKLKTIVDPQKEK